MRESARRTGYRFLGFHDDVYRLGMRRNLLSIDASNLVGSNAAGRYLQERHQELHTYQYIDRVSGLASLVHNKERPKRRRTVEKITLVFLDFLPIEFPHCAVITSHD